MDHSEIGDTGLMLPSVVFGTTTFGNIFQVYPEEDKMAVLKEIFRQVDSPVGLDSAGKYGAGMSLEFLGHGLRHLDIDPQDVIISNKLAWRRTPLITPEPTFEPGAWFGLDHDATQDISYDGILRCWEEGNDLLGEGYCAQMVSVHDPDEYLATAKSSADRDRLFGDILNAYKALGELKKSGKAKAIGVGAKDWHSICEIAHHVDLDWVMFANSMTLYSHPADLLDFMDELAAKNVTILNSAVFNAGFLTGGEFFNYRRLVPNDREDQKLFAWRERFFATCQRFDVSPAHVCIQFGKSHPAVHSLALSSSKPARVRTNIDLATDPIEDEIWLALKEEGLLEAGYPYVGCR